MEELLTEWNLECLLTVFNKNDINPKNILELNNDLIKELIPSVGLRLKFYKKLNDYKLKNQSVVDLPVVISEDLEFLGQLVEPSSSISDISGSGSLHSFTDKGFEETQLDFDLKTLLTYVPYGSLILKYYKEHERLNEYMRNKLVDAVIRNLYPYIMKCNLSHQQYNILTSKIINCFPNECHSIYYQSGKHLGSCLQPKGKLVDKVKNLRYQSPDKIYQRKRKLSKQEEIPPKQLRLLTEDENQAITWLKFNREPWDEVLKFWKLTFKLRQDFVCQTAAEFMSEWPIMSDPRAESLIESDFVSLYPEKELLLLNNWEDFFNKILALKRTGEIKDLTFKELLNNLDNQKNLSADSRTALQLTLLAQFIPPKGRAKHGNSHWKFSTLESLESLIIHCQNANDILVKVEQQIEKASKRRIGKEIQPYLLVQGESLTNIKHTYIIVDKIQFKCVSTLKGLDFLFKIFFVLKLKYPCQAQHIWTLIQKGIYKIHISEDKLIPYIEEILSLFN